MVLMIVVVVSMVSLKLGSARSPTVEIRVRGGSSGLGVE